jgi:hypothetical protein
MAKKTETQGEVLKPVEGVQPKSDVVRVKFNKNVRYNRTSFVDGDIADVPAADYEQMTEHCSIVSESAE